MSDGLITRIGKWIDNKWESKASERDLIERTQRLERMIKEIDLVVKVSPEVEKVIVDLKTRIEKIELYAGMTRKVDPTKPPVVKSAFQM